MRDANEFPHGRAQWLGWAAMLAIGLALIVALFLLGPSGS